VWENKVTIAVSETELADYMDGNGDQHYVAKLAGINADGSVVDWRAKGGLAEHVTDSDPHPQYTTEEELEIALQSLGDEQLKNMVGMIGEFHSDSSIAGWVDLKGGEISRTTDKLLWGYAVDAGMVIQQSTKDVDPISNAMKFGDGDGVTTFTLPNHHLGHFVRGNPSGVDHGETQESQNKEHSHNATGTAYAYSHLGTGPGRDFKRATVTTTIEGRAEARPLTANLSIKIHRGWM
jgi:hypothetical protein